MEAFFIMRQKERVYANEFLRLDVSTLRMADDLEQILSSEELQLKQDREIGRILNCYEWDYFSILELNPLDRENLGTLIRRTYRRKSLLIHPDKTSNPDTAKAFDTLKRAELALSVQGTSADPDFDKLENNTKARILDKERIFAIYDDLAKPFLSENKITKDTTPLDPNYQLFVRQVTNVLLLVIKDEEIERNFQQRQEAIKLAEIQLERKKKAEERAKASKWEDDRDDRVHNWRVYKKKAENKSKKKQKENSKSKVLA